MTDYKPFKLQLENSKVRLELVPEFGGRINSLVLSDEFDVNLIAGHDSRDALAHDTGYRGIPLFPFPNRLAAGRYSFQGKTYQVAINEPGSGHALHGFLYHLTPQISIQTLTKTCAHATAVYDYPGNVEGYPFPSRVEFQYKLHGESLKVEVKITNTGTRPLPVGFGWHPYYQLDERVDDLYLQTPPLMAIEIDKTNMATGKKTPYPHFEKLKKIGDLRLDNGFEITGKEPVASLKLWSEKHKRGLDIWQDAGPDGMNFTQIFIPPGRESIAIEPMSCSINAFNSGDGLRTVEPGKSTSGTFGVRLISHKPG